MLESEMMGELSDYFHVLCIAACDVGFQDFEDATFASLGDWVSPGETNHRADASLGKDGLLNLDLIFLDLRVQFLINNDAHFFDGHIGDPVLELNERVP